MAVTFTSNRKATQVLSDSTGFTGPLDYILNMDVINDRYFKSNGLVKSEVKIEDAVTVVRTSNGNVYDRDLNSIVVGQNIPRRSYLPQYKSFGLVIEEAKYNFFDNSNLKEQTVALPVNTKVYGCYAKGGFAKVSSSEVEILQGDGSFNNPMFFKQLVNGTSNPTISLSGSIQSVQVEQCIGHNSLSTVIGESQRLKAAENCSVNIDKAMPKGTIVIKVMESAHQLIGSTVDDYVPYLSCKLDDSNYIAVNRRVNKDTLTLRLFKDGAEASVAQIGLSKKTNIIALSWNSGVIRYSINGVSNEHIVSMGATFTVNAISLLSSILGWVQYSGNSALTNMVLYNRQLSLSELDNATQSWQ
ncbi:hypothetical protein ACFODO_13990 [Acinetobacter sichuanensis]|uniref:Uncharacterized protein n=1 Tax=Acinetobacter sichuanensis TaxID=2136183 RepID=A0A371YJP8_9GAMM|nr:hypothetical protein [Acinetobacter sichuanensis]RFC81682.1 hypothetical protein C9E89_020500 [Acinetobacter sichuanensis]